MICASDFLGIVKGKYDYLFFLVSDIYWLESAGAESLKPVLERVFAQRLGSHGAVVTSFSENVEENYNKILAKAWSKKLRKCLLNPRDPKLLVIAEDFATFDPQRHRFALIDFLDYRGDSDKVFEILREIEQVVKSGEDLFVWWERKASATKTLLGRIGRAIEIKPSIWFFSIDLKKFLRWN